MTDGLDDVAALRGGRIYLDGDNRVLFIPIGISRSLRFPELTLRFLGDGVVIGSTVKWTNPISEPEPIGEVV